MQVLWLSHNYYLPTTLMEDVIQSRFSSEIISHREIEAVLDMATYLTNCDATCTGEFIDYPV